jgi:Helicase conserved C-terminal domain
VIVDEFDEFVVIEEGDRETAARYAANWRRLHAQLTARYLIKSATLGLSSLRAPQKTPTKATRRAQLIANLLNPLPIVVPQRCYATVAPFKQIRAIVLEDGRVANLLDAIHISKGNAHLRLDEIVGPLDYNDVERRAATICDSPLGRKMSIRTELGLFRSIAINAETRHAFCSIVSFIMMPQHIVEDLSDGLAIRIGTIAIKTAMNENIFVEGAHILVDNRKGNRFKFKAGGKAYATIELALRRSRSGQRGVLFIRTLTLMAGLRTFLSNADIQVFYLSGEMADSTRRRSIDGFKNSTNGLLVMTRTTGGRGLDLPFAHYSIFYSPKTDPITMWQEASRIRSTAANPKDIVVLCYGDSEIDRMKSIVNHWEAQGKHSTWDQLYWICV